MLLITASKAQRLLYLNYVGRLTAAEMTGAQDELKAAMAELPPGFRLLADLSQVESIDPDCAPEIGRAMELFDQHDVSLILRVIPDASKDIGFNILMIFHYLHHPRVINCLSLGEALQKLAIWS